MPRRGECGGRRRNVPWPGGRGTSAISGHAPLQARGWSSPPAAFPAPSLLGRMERSWAEGGAGPVWRRWLQPGEAGGWMPHCALGLDLGRGSGTIHLSGCLCPTCSHWGRVPGAGLVLSAQGLHVGGEQRPSSPQPRAAPGLCLPEGPGRLLRCCPAPSPTEPTATLQRDTRLRPGSCSGTSDPLDPLFPSALFPSALSLWVSRAASPRTEPGTSWGMLPLGAAAPLWLRVTRASAFLRC